jgi:hypothetical protein
MAGKNRNTPIIREIPFFLKVFIKWLLSSVTAENHGDIMLGNVNVYIPEEYRKDETDESTGWTIKRKHQGRQ